MECIVNGPNPGRWVDRVVGWCFGFLGAVIALWCAVRVLEVIWPALAVIVGIATLIVITIRIVVYYTSQKF
jgi:hypothetical protein